MPKIKVKCEHCEKDLYRNMQNYTIKMGYLNNTKKEGERQCYLNHMNTRNMPLPIS